MSYDLLVVGAGPSGSTAARYVASSGFKVLVLEKKKLDREKACAGGISGRVINEFGIPDKAFDRSIYGDFVCSPKYLTVLLEKTYRIGACVMRGKFDKVLCDIAMDKGAEFKEESEVVEPIFEDKTLVGLKSREKGEIHEYRGKVTIIAEGSSARMSRELGVHVGDPHAIFLCYQQQMELPNSKISERIGDNLELYFGIIPVGYAWIFPKDNMVSVGLGTPLSIIKEQRIDLKRRLEEFVKHHPVAKEKLKESKVLFSQAALIPHGGLGNDESKIVTKIYGNGYVIVGDAAGFVSPATGEGVYYGMKSAKLAAEVVADSLEIGDFSENTLAEYHKKVLESIIYEDMKFGWKIRRMFLESDRSTERVVRASKEDPWFGELTRELISGEIPYRDFMGTLYRHPHKLLKALLFF